MAFVGASVFGAYNAVEEEKCTHGNRLRGQTPRFKTGLPTDENCRSPDWYKDSSREHRVTASGGTARPGADKTAIRAMSPSPGYWPSTSEVSTPFEEDSDDDAEVIKAFSQPMPTSKDKSQNIVQKAKSLFGGTSTSKRSSLPSFCTKA
mmetsp:Transcript_68869/g.128558  ORF Transcript_68869/g.128558 Transcript_68869/m.128558 type:complete len:149 (+) Transcript_68869:82-528(+)